MDIAAAAIKQAASADAERADEEEEIPIARERHPARERAAAREERHERQERAAKPPRSTKPAVRGARPAEPFARLYIGAGRKLKVRPGDIVGAIANEAGLEGSRIGAIQVFDRHSIVEVPESHADDIVATLSAAKIKGKKLQVRRDRSGK